MYEFAQWLESSRLTVFIQSTSWIIPMVQSVHIIAIGIVFVAVFTIALRVLGWMRTDQAFAEVLGRFAPWIRRGLVVLATTGVILVIGEPVRELMSLSFWLKMALLAIGVLTALAFSRSVAPAPGAAAPEPQFSAAARYAAVATVLLWLAIIFLGRAIAYDVEVWGPLSLSPRA